MSEMRKHKSQTILNENTAWKLFIGPSNMYTNNLIIIIDTDVDMMGFLGRPRLPKGPRTPSRKNNHNLRG